MTADRMITSINDMSYHDQVKIARAALSCLSQEHSEGRTPQDRLAHHFLAIAHRALSAALTAQTDNIGGLGRLMGTIKELVERAELGISRNLPAAAVEEPNA